MISIIVPIFNSEKYLEECIESILAQTYKDLDIILVDNNSTDSSYEICKKFQIIDSRISIVKEDNPGAAYARNAGLRVAKGDYVTFIDSDDYIRKDAYDILNNLAIKYTPDIICFSFNYIDEDGKKLNWYEPKLDKYTSHKKCFNGKEIAEIYLTSNDIEGFGWNKIFRHEYLIKNKCMFDESKRAYEDMVMIFDAVIRSSKIVLCPEKLYYYRNSTESESLTHVSYHNKYKEYCDSVNKISRIARQHGIDWETDIYEAFVDVNIKTNRNSKDDNHIKWRHGFLKTLFLIVIGYRTQKVRNIAKMILYTYGRKRKV